MAVPTDLLVKDNLKGRDPKWPVSDTGVTESSAIEIYEDHSEL